MVYQIELEENHITILEETLGFDIERNDSDVSEAVRSFIEEC